MQYLNEEYLLLLSGCCPSLQEKTFPYQVLAHFVSHATDFFLHLQLKCAWHTHMQKQIIKIKHASRTDTSFLQNTTLITTA